MSQASENLISCPKCGNTPTPGQVWDDWMYGNCRPCPTCNGTGKIKAPKTSERPYDACVRTEQERLALEAKHKAEKDAQVQQELGKRYLQSLELRKRGTTTQEAIEKHWCTACRLFLDCSPYVSPPNPAFESQCGGISWQQDSTLKIVKGPEYKKVEDVA